MPWFIMAYNVDQFQILQRKQLWKYPIIDQFEFFIHLLSTNILPLPQSPCNCRNDDAGSFDFVIEIPGLEDNSLLAACVWINRMSGVIQTFLFIPTTFADENSCRIAQTFHMFLCLMSTSIKVTAIVIYSLQSHLQLNEQLLEFQVWEILFSQLLSSAIVVRPDPILRSSIHVLFLGFRSRL